MNNPYMNRYESMPQRTIVAATLIGALTAGVVRSTINMKKVKEDGMDTSEAAFDTAKGAIQGAIAAATVTSVSDSLSGPNRSVVNALTKTAIGVSAVYAVEKVSDNVRTKIPALAHTETPDETEA